MQNSKTYHIRADYKPNLEQATFDSSKDPSYWNPLRLQTATLYQYDVYKVAAKLAKLHKALTLLDVGSGPPLKLKELMPSGLKIHLVDQPNAARHAAEILPSAIFHAVNLESEGPKIEVAFDLILCADVIEHLIDPDPCLRFMCEHLSPNGLLLISTPERVVLRGTTCTHSPHPMHVREWTKDEFRNYLESRGLEIIKHFLLPQQKVSNFKLVFGKLMHMFGFPPAWYSCQLAVCRPTLVRPLDVR